MSNNASGIKTDVIFKTMDKNVEAFKIFDMNDTEVNCLFFFPSFELASD